MKVIMKKPIVISASPVRTATLTAGQFLRLSDAQKRNIAKTTILPPKLGEKCSASFRVLYKTPVYKAP